MQLWEQYHTMQSFVYKWSRYIILLQNEQQINFFQKLEPCDTIYLSCKNCNLPSSPVNQNAVCWMEAEKASQKYAVLNV